MVSDSEVFTYGFCVLCCCCLYSNERTVICLEINAEKDQGVIVNLNVMLKDAQLL
jgi:hypothetical protein